jgi:hypothetical protein
VQPEDGQAVSERTAFTRTSGAERKLDDARAIAVGNEPEMREKERFVAGGALLDVRLDEDFAARDEHASDLVE